MCGHGPVRCGSKASLPGREDPTTLRATPSLSCLHFAFRSPGVGPATRGGGGTLQSERTADEPKKVSKHLRSVCGRHRCFPVPGGSECVLLRNALLPRACPNFCEYCGRLTVRSCIPAVTESTRPQLTGCCPLSARHAPFTSRSVPPRSMSSDLRRIRRTVRQSRTPGHLRALQTPRSESRRAWLFERPFLHSPI